MHSLLQFFLSFLFVLVMANYIFNNSAYTLKLALQFFTLHHLFTESFMPFFLSYLARIIASRIYFGLVYLFFAPT